MSIHKNAASSDRPPSRAQPQCGDATPARIRRKRTQTDPRPASGGPGAGACGSGGAVRRTLFILAIPVLGEQMLNTFVGLFDTWLAGRISPVATSAVGVAAYVSWLASMMVMLVGTGTTALVARHEGAGDRAEANRDTNQSMILAAILGLLILVLLFAMAPWVAGYLGMTGRAFDITVSYLRTEALGHVFMSVTLVGCAALRGLGNMRTPMYIFAIINAVNVIASYFFVYGIDMGVSGIVLGTVTARTLGAILMVALLIRGRAGLILVRRELRLSWNRTWRILRIGLPAAADGAIMWTGHFAFLAIVSSAASEALGQACLAAHIIAVRVEALTYLPAVAWGMATATMIGQALGAKNPALAKRTGHEAVLQCGLLSVLIAVGFYFGAEWIYEQMSLDPLVRRIGPAPFRVLALLQPCLVISIVYVWGLRGAGDTRWPLFITIVGILIRLPVGYFFGVVRGGGLMGAWFGMFGDMLWRALAAGVRYTRGRWLTTKV